MEQKPTIWEVNDFWYTEPDLRLWLSISRDTFRRWRKRGLPCIGSGRLRRYHGPTVVDWIANSYMNLR